MQLRYEFDEMTDAGDASRALRGNCHGEVEFNSEESYLKFITNSNTELLIATKTIGPFLKTENC